MPFLSSLRSFFGRTDQSAGASRKPRPRLESLEDRLVPVATNQDFVNNVVKALANRNFDAAKDQALVDGLNAKTLNLQDVASLVETSDDGINTLISRLYQDVLIRNVDPTGQQFFFTSFKAGMKYQDAKAMLLASDEYFTRFAGGDNSSWVSAAFADQMGRQADPTGQAFFGGILGNAAGGTGQQRRFEASRFILNSVEGATREMQSLYTSYLLRAADNVGAAFFASQMTAFAGFPSTPVAEQSIIVQLVGSQEFFNRSDPAAG